MTARFALPFVGNTLNANASSVGSVVQVRADAGSNVTVQALGTDARATFTVSVAGRFE